MIKPSRRDFIRLLLSSAAASQFDVEKLLWVARPMILVPRLTASQIIELELWRSRWMKQIFERDDIFYAQILGRSVEHVSSREIRIPLVIKPGQ